MSLLFLFLNGCHYPSLFQFLLSPFLLCICSLCCFLFFHLCHFVYQYLHLLYLHSFLHLVIYPKMTHLLSGHVIYLPLNVQHELYFDGTCSHEDHLKVPTDVFAVHVLDIIDIFSFTSTNLSSSPMALLL